ncbi:hypothetical protein MKK88_30930, partial [Methylobacterium sp. E-005]|nr:hypothetical protein [Methylobacterium sp. E-005]
SYRDLGGKTVVVTAGTTNEKAVRDQLARLKIDAQVVTAPDHAASYAIPPSPAEGGGRYGAELAPAEDDPSRKKP